MFFSQGGSSLEEQPGGAGRLLSCPAFSLRLGLARYAAAGTPTCPGAHYECFKQQLRARAYKGVVQIS